MYQQIFRHLFIAFFLFSNLYTYSVSDTTKWKKNIGDLLGIVGDHPDSTLSEGIKILESAKKQNLKEWEAKAHYMIGVAYYYKEKDDLALEYLLKLYSYENDIKNYYYLGYAASLVGYIYDDAKKSELAIDAFLKSAEYYKIYDYPRGMGNDFLEIGNIYYGDEDYDKAESYYLQAIKQYKIDGYDKGLASCNYNLANLENYKRKNYPAAEKYYLEAIKFYEITGNEKQKANSSFYLAEIYDFFLNKPEEAKKYYQQSFDKRNEGADKKETADSYFSLGKVSLRSQNYDDAARNLQLAADIYNELGLQSELGDTYINMGNIYFYRGNYPKSQEYYRLSRTAYEKAGSIDGQAGSLVGLANLFHGQGDDEKALQLYQESLKLYEKSGNTHYSGIASVYTGIGNCYYDDKDYDKALEYYVKGLEYDEKADDAEGKIVKMINISAIYSYRGEAEKAVEYLEKTLAESKKIQNKLYTSSTLKSLGFHYLRQKEYDKAIDYCSEGLQMAEEMKVLPQQADNCLCLYQAYYYKEDYKNSLSYYMTYNDVNDSMVNEKNVRELTKMELSYEYDKKEAMLKLEQEKKAMELQDEINRKQMMFQFEQQQAKMRAEAEKKELALKSKAEQNKLAMEEEMKRQKLAMEFDKKETQAKLESERKDIEFAKDIEKKEIENASQKRLTYFFIGGFGVMCILAFFIFRSYRDKQKANKIILQQKEEVERQKSEIEIKSSEIEEKNREIVDSITYARRLQEAILPPLKLVRDYLYESFIIYKPKDIVAGDFYWMETIQSSAGSSQSSELPTENRRLILFAVADCTGHGVPGAMVSVVCSNALNRAVKEFHIQQPAAILDKVTGLVIETFEKSESDVKDGMDISLCALNLDTLKLEWAGANNPLWIIRSNSNEIEEYKPDKQPIGKYDNRKPFTNHIIQLKKGDFLYMFSDGYADQFGGSSGKKFKYSKMKEQLLSMRNKTMDEQKDAINTTFEKWKGELEQVDDVCLIGVRL